MMTFSISVASTLSEGYNMKLAFVPWTMGHGDYQAITKVQFKIDYFIF